jgi:hypothetical protein
MNQGNRQALEQEARERLLDAALAEVAERRLRRGPAAPPRRQTSRWFAAALVLLGTGVAVAVAIAIVGRKPFLNLNPGFFTTAPNSDGVFTFPLGSQVGQRLFGQLVVEELVNGAPTGRWAASRGTWFGAAP